MIDVRIRTRIIALAVISVVFAAAYCFSDRPPKSSPTSHLTDSATQQDQVTQTGKGPGHPVIGHLISRNEKITILAGKEGLLYTIADESGSVTLREVSEEELQVNRPQLYERLQRGYAGAWAGIQACER